MGQSAAAGPSRTTTTSEDADIENVNPAAVPRKPGAAGKGDAPLGEGDRAAKALPVSPFALADQPGAATKPAGKNIRR